MVYLAPKLCPGPGHHGLIETTRLVMGISKQYHLIIHHQKHLVRTGHQHLILIVKQPRQERRGITWI